MPPILSPTAAGGGGGGLSEAEVEALIDSNVAALVDSSPGTLDTLNELAAALGDDPNFATTVAASIGAKVDKATLDANTLLGATADNTPIAFPVAASRIVGRKSSGDIGDLTPAEVGALFAGTSFPSSPADRQTFYRTDRDIQYFYDLANTRWLSVQEFVQTFPMTNLALTSGETAAASNSGRLSVPFRGTYSILLTRFQISANVQTTNDGSNYWTIKLNRADTDDNDVQIGSTMDTSAQAVGKWVDQFISPNVVLDATARLLKLRVDKVGSPQQLLITGLLSYRVVG